MAKIVRTSKPLADVNVLNPKDPKLPPKKEEEKRIVVCCMPNPSVLIGEKNSSAVLAIDGSASMSKMFGEPPTIFNPEPKPNHVQMIARTIASILCDVTKQGTASAIYWAVGPGGEHTEEIGEFDLAGWTTAEVNVPKNMGRGTKILPAIKHITENVFANAAWTMGVIITDGIIEDEPDAMDYCMKLGQKLKDDGDTENFKLVLIGVGQEVDQDQLERFDDMFEGTALGGDDGVDIWSHGVAASMQDKEDILGALFGEMVDEDTPVADSGSILDANGNEIKSFADGLPGKFEFILPAGQTSFSVHTPGAEVAQDISEVF